MASIDTLTPEQALQNLRDAGLTKEAAGAEKRFREVGTIRADRIDGDVANVPVAKPSNFATQFQNILSGGEELKGLDLSTVTQEDVLGAKAGVFSQALDLIKGTEGKAVARQEAFEDEDITGKTEAITNFQNKLEAEERSLDITTRRLQENPEGLGATALSGRIQDVERQSLQKQADIAILGNAAARNLETSLGLIDQRLELEFGPKEEALASFRKQIEFASPFLGEISGYLEDQAAQQEQDLAEQRGFTQDLLNLAVDAQKAGNTALANQFTAMARQDDISFDDIVGAQQAAVGSGVYTGDAPTPGGYTDQEVRKLRAAGIDAADTATADEFLYGSKTRPAKDDAELQTIKQLIIDNGWEVGDIVETDSGDIRLSPEQQEQVRGEVETQSTRRFKASNLPGIKQAVDAWDFLFR